MKEFMVYVGEKPYKVDYGWLPAVYHLLLD